MTYAALACQSNYSFLEGASHPHELVETAHALGLRALALCDRDGLYGVVRAHVRAKELGVQLIVGAQVSMLDGTRVRLLVQNHEGYRRVCRLLTGGHRAAAKGQAAVSWEQLCEHATGVLLLWGGSQSRLNGDEEPGVLGAQLKEAFGDRLYAFVARHRQPADWALERRLRARAQTLKLPVVGGNEVLYHVRERRALQDVLTCIREGVALAAAGTRIQANDEHMLQAPAVVAQLFADDPFALECTREIAARCTFSLAEIRYRYPSTRLPSGKTSSEWLRQLTLDGARWRYDGVVPADVLAQLERELQLIEELDYGGYFLTMHEVVCFCAEKGILCQGRGSAANSAVCYCLGITAVDPVRLDLLFERFISRERAEPPDIDLDIAHERREEVIQHVYAKYGRSHAAMVANVVRYRPKSAVRDVGKTLGVPETTLDRLAKLIERSESTNSQLFVEMGVDARTAVLLEARVNEILEFPRHLSIHPGGFLVGHEPVHDLVPIENATMDGRTVIQWDKYDVEDLGLFKIDLLGLGALTLVDKAFQLIKACRGQTLSLATLPAGDATTYERVGEGDTVGVFQIESRAQMAMLPRLKPRTFYDLVIEVALVRPGPISGGMVHPYLRRRNQEEPIEYPHESLRPVLAKTLGVPLFQEQVMKLAMVAADYTPGEADQLRRDMAAWRSAGRIEQHHERLVSRMIEKGITPEFAERVFQQIRGFGEYGFPESHAASFALLAYATAYLKVHYLPEFTCALLNAQPMGFYSPATIVEDARRHGLKIYPVCVILSEWDCTIESEGPTLCLRMGLRYVKGLPEHQVRALHQARASGQWRGLDDFVRRTKFSVKDLRTLAEAGALEGFGPQRRQALWEVQRLSREQRDVLPLAEMNAPPQFSPLSLPELIEWDYRKTFHSTRGHPLGPMRDELKRQGLVDAKTVSGLRDGLRIRSAGLVICRQRPDTKSGVVFVTLEDETGVVNVVIWPRVFERYARVVKTTSFLGVSGRLQVAHGVAHLIAESLWVPHVSQSPVYVDSRDFH